MNFWQSLKKPFFVVAPMADVTDPAFRRLISEYQSPDVMWTEFVSADGLFHTRTRGIMEDKDNPLLRDLQFTPGEHPIVAQLFSSNPENMKYASMLARDLGFDGVDINMGCPDKAIERQGCGSAMIKQPEVATEIIEAAKASGLPVSVKTRIGYNTEDIDGWIRHVLQQKPAALTVHLRTRKEMSKVPAHWDLMPQIVALRNEVSPDTLILGNGDVESLEDAKAKVEATGCDGIMLGRAIFGSPWLFTGRTPEEVPPRERIESLQKLTQYFSELRPSKSVHILKKHVKAFITGWDGATSLRKELMSAESIEEFSRILEAHSAI